MPWIIHPHPEEARSAVSKDAERQCCPNSSFLQFFAAAPCLAHAPAPEEAEKIAPSAPLCHCEERQRRSNLEGSAHLTRDCRASLRPACNDTEGNMNNEMRCYRPLIIGTRGAVAAKH